MSTTAPDMNLAQGSSATAVTERPTEVHETPAPAMDAPAFVEPRGTSVAARTVPPAGLGVVGLLTLLVGAWGGIVPFVGPSFGFSGDGSLSWYWSFAHAMLWLVPGAVATACGLMMLGLVPRALAGFGRLGSGLTGLLTALCGAWFVIGPLAWPVLRLSAGVFVPASPLRELAYEVGYSVGTGLLLAVFGAFAIGWALRSRTPVATAAAPSLVP